MDRCDLCTDWLLDIEGFYSDDPSDRGGATKFGISLRCLRAQPGGAGDLDGDGDVDAADVCRVTLERARDIYRTQFWNLCRCGELPVGIDAALFCAAVNHGPGVAIVLLQEALRVRIDGRIGPQTLAAARRAQRDQLVADLLSRRAQFYADLVRSDSSQAQFERGWYRRLFLLQQFILR